MATSGEQAAISGYHTQFKIAAWEIYAAITHGNLEWLELASVEAGNLDDVFIGLTDKILAWQIKDRSNRFTYNEFANIESGLIVKMFASWAALAQKHAGKPIDCRLITTQEMSSHDVIQSFGAADKPSFASFVKNCWNKIRAGESYGKNWEPVLDELCVLLHCQQPQLLDFIRSTHLSFDYTLPDQKDYNPLAWLKVTEDTDKIRHFIFDTIGEGNHSLHFTSRQLIERLGFNRRIQTYFQHDFFVDDEHYAPIKETLKALDDATTKFNAGYIAIVGSAGSGKSTLLTKWANDSNNQVLKYYSYVNQDMTYDSGYRGESRYFLHDIITQIYQNSPQERQHIPSADRFDLSAQLAEELQRLSRNFESRGSKTFIIVDGLDHIKREQKVEYSLLNDLPDPAAIPPGVYFILGSRAIENLAELNVTINLSLNKDNRIIHIGSLHNREVISIVKSYSSLSLDDAQLQKLYTNTLGHPLFLRYTIEKLLSAETGQFDEIINNHQFTGDIHDEYQKFWLPVKADQPFVTLLGIVSRFRFSFVEISLLEKNFDFTDATLSKLVTEAKYFFNVPQAGKWQYFHNSFKWFIENVTAVAPLSGSFDESRDQKFHTMIADTIASCDSNYKWNLIYHLFKAKRYQDIIAVATQDYFRNQWFAFRLVHLITEDLAITAKAATHLHDIPILVRCLLMASEFRQRRFNFDPASFYRLYLYNDMQDIADAYIYEGKELLVDRETALDYCIALLEQGQEKTARSIFELAEPGFILFHSKEVNPGRYSSTTYTRIDEVELVAKWAAVAIHYYELPQIISIIEELRLMVNEDPNSSTPKKQEGISLNLVVKCMRSIIENDKNKNPVIIADCIQYMFSKIGYHKLLLDILYWILFEFQLEERTLLSQIIAFINDWPEADDQTVNTNLALIQVYITKNLSKAIVRFEQVNPPAAEKNTFSNKGHLLVDIFDYARLYFILTANSLESFLQLLPPVTDPNEAVLYRQAASIAFHYSNFYRGNQAAVSDILIQLKSILSFFHKHFLDLDYNLRNLKNETLSLVTNLMHATSVTDYLSVIDTIAADWHEHPDFWNANNIRTVISNVANDTSFWDWCSKELSYLEGVMLEKTSPYERADQCINQAFVWLKINDKTACRYSLDEAFRQTLGIGNEKDYQLDYLLKWLPVMDEYEPGKTVARMNWFLSRIDFVRNASSRAHWSIAKHSLQLSLKRCPSDGYKLAKWLLLHKLMDFAEVIEIVLAHSCATSKIDLGLFTTIFTRVVLFFQDDGNYGYDFLPAAFELLNSAEQVSALIDEIAIYGIPEKRNGVIRQIIKHSKAKNIATGLDPDDYPVKDNYTSTSEDIIELESGEKLSLDELLQRVTSQDIFFDYLKQKKIYSGFEWTKLLAGLRNILTEDFITKFVAVKDGDSLELSAVAKIALDAGFTELAKSLAYKALAKSRPAGWNKQYDGGSKIKPYELLVKVEEQNKVSKMMMQDLAFSFKDLDHKHIAEELMPMLELLLPSKTDMYPVIYGEIEQYLQALFLNAAKNKDDFEFTNEDNTATELFAGFLVLLFEFPAPSLSENLVGALVKSYPGSEKMIDAVTKQLFSLGYHDQFLQVIEGIARTAPLTLKAHENQLTELMGSPRFDITVIAAGLLALIGIFPEPVQTGKDLPVVYTMHFEDKRELIVDKELMLEQLEKRRGLRETNDPVEFIGFYKQDAIVFSKESGFPLVNIAHRIMQLAGEQRLPAWYDAFTEKDIANLFKGIELNMAYLRPRMMRLWKAVTIVVKELLETEHVGPYAASLIGINHDADLTAVIPGKRPAFITGVQNEKGGKAGHYDFNEKWVNNITAGTFLQLHSSVEDNFLLAEYSRFVSMDNCDASELRQSFIAAIAIKDTPEEHIFFQSDLFNQTIGEYDQIEDNAVIIQNKGNSFDPRRNWIAVNPLLCEQAGWTLAAEGLFRWVDSSGVVMVESKFWLDGNYQNHERFLDSETGYGWYVIASKKAYDSIVAIIQPPVYFHKKINRNYRLVQERYGTNIDAKEHQTLTQVIA